MDTSSAFSMFTNFFSFSKVPPIPGVRNEQGTYEPSPIDVFVVREMITSSSKLPPDLVDIIFDYAEYWAHSESAVDFEAALTGGQLRVQGGDTMENEFVLRSFPVGVLSEHGGHMDLTGEAATAIDHTKEPEPGCFAKLADYPTPKLVNPVRKIVFTMRSHDQGWGGDADDPNKPFDSAWTWFEAGLERFDQNSVDNRKGNTVAPFQLNAQDLRPVHPIVEQDDTTVENSEESRVGGYEFDLLPNTRWLIQKNKRADNEWQDHEVIWRYTDCVEPASDAAHALVDQGRSPETADGEFLRQLRVGDVITMWAKARFHGWVNNVQSASIRIYWAL